MPRIHKPVLSSRSVGRSVERSVGVVHGEYRKGCIMSLKRHEGFSIDNWRVSTTPTDRHLNDRGLETGFWAYLV